MKHKTIRYKSGGGVGDDVRARAMRFLQGETELSGQYHEDPLAKVIKDAEARDKARQKPSEAAQRVIEEGRRLDAARGASSNAQPRTRSLKPSEEVKPIEPAWGISGFKSGGKIGSASKRADGIARKGKTRGKVL